MNVETLMPVDCPPSPIPVFEQKVVDTDPITNKHTHISRYTIEIGAV
jgi:hypothetical protein